MSYFKGTKGPWKAEESFMKGHTSVDAPAHGAIIQVLTKMDNDWSLNFDRTKVKEEELQANLRAVVCAPEMAELLLELHHIGEPIGINKNPALNSIVAKLKGDK